MRMIFTSDLHIGHPHCMFEELKEGLRKLAPGADAIQFLGDFCDVLAAAKAAMAQGVAPPAKSWQLGLQRTKKLLATFFAEARQAGYFQKLSFVSGGDYHERSLLASDPDISYEEYSLLSSSFGKVFCCHGHQLFAALDKRAKKGTPKQLAVAAKELLIAQPEQFFDLPIRPTKDWTYIFGHLHSRYRVLGANCWGLGSWLLDPTGNIDKKLLARHQGLFLVLDDEVDDPADFLSFVRFDDKPLQD